MELGGVLGLDSYMVGSSSSFETSEAAAAAMKQKGLFGGARFLKHGRSSSSFEPLHEDQQEDDEWNNNNSSSPNNNYNNNNNNKVAKTDHHQPGPAAPSPFLFRSNFDSHSLFPQGEQMLSFSSSTTTSRPNANALMLSNISSNDGPSCHQYYSQINPISSSSAAAPPSFYRNATPGIISGSSNLNVNAYMNSMNYMNMQQQQQQVGGVGGPFTPSQWMELEYQALIYKHIDANVPVPPNLLIPIRRSINQSPLSNYPPGSFRPAPLGWGSYHLGFSGNADPEPGRCRRTDGKKWRCSRDAVADQKYCERHMNRGRHRSRKLVEGRSGQASSSSSSRTMSMPLIASSSSQHSTTSAASIGLPILQQQAKSLLPNFMDPSPSQLNRNLMSEESLNESIQNSQGLSLLTAGSTKPGNSLASILKHHNPFEAHSLNPPRSSYSENVSFDSSLQLEARNSQTQNHHLRHFIDDWPKAQPDHQPIAWPELEDMKSDRTQLSISIPTDFSSSTSSPNQEKLALSPLRLSREFNPINEENRRQSSWIPISWEPTIGGPLGEALTNTNSSSKDLNFSKNCSSSSLNLLTDGWDSSSPILDSSPTGVLQKTTFGSLSSSTGSSPRADNLKVIDSTSNMCDNLLGSTL